MSEQERVMLQRASGGRWHQVPRGDFTSSGALEVRDFVPATDLARVERERESSERHFTIALRSVQKLQDKAERERDELAEERDKLRELAEGGYGQGVRDTHKAHEPLVFEWKERAEEAESHLAHAVEDTRVIRWQIERFEECVTQVDPPDSDRFYRDASGPVYVAYPDDMQTLGWARVLCDDLLASLPQPETDSRTDGALHEDAESVSAPDTEPRQSSSAEPEQRSGREAAAPQTTAEWLVARDRELHLRRGHLADLEVIAEILRTDPRGPCAGFDIKPSKMVPTLENIIEVCSANLDRKAAAPATVPAEPLWELVERFGQLAAVSTPEAALAFDDAASRLRSTLEADRG